MDGCPKSPHSREYIRQTIDTTMEKWTWGRVRLCFGREGFLHNGDPSYPCTLCYPNHSVSPTLLKFVGVLLTIYLSSNHLKVKIWSLASRKQKTWELLENILGRMVKWLAPYVEVGLLKQEKLTRDNGRERVLSSLPLHWTDLHWPLTQAYPLLHLQHKYPRGSWISLAWAVWTAWALPIRGQ